ncbi:MAG: hypothetical protein K2J89_05265, partial [Clostridia bacterium]|nr:hypothetical protein [Clostridia bacterium]
KFNLPIITYICDEYYFVKKKGGVLKHIQLFSLHRKIRKLLNNSKHIITICQELQDAYAREFNAPITTIMTGSNYPIAKTVEEKKEVNSISYLGNIRCNRFNSLAEIGQALDKLNTELGSDYKLKIYTSENNEEILDKLRVAKSIELCGFIVGDEFKRTLDSADLLLHTEAFDEESIDYVKHSVSTKIADSLGSGVCLLAYGPSNVASMQHLIRNGCALIATSKEELPLMLGKAFTDMQTIKGVAFMGLNTAKEFHDCLKTSQQLHLIMESIHESIANK